MPYAIMRCTKLSSPGNVAAALQHCFRERDTPNADADRTPQNSHLAAMRVSDAQARMKQLLPEKRRKDAVIAVEYLFTASPEWFRAHDEVQHKELFRRSLDWLAEKYGRDRIVTATIHQDETSPHLSAFVVPLTQDGRLSAKEFIGNREKMRTDQTTYAAAVASLGLERGIEGSQATHQTIREYYAGIQQSTQHHLRFQPEAVVPQKTGMFSKETPAQVAERLETEVNRLLSPVYSQATTARAERHRHQEVTRTLEQRKAHDEKISRLTRNLNPEQTEQLRQLADSMRRENLQKAKDRQLQRQLSRGRDDGGYER